jgi:transposase
MSDGRVVAPTSRRYTKAQREHAIRLVRQIREETGERHGAIQRVARQLGYGVETVRKWVKQADVDAGERTGRSTEDNAKIRRLEQEVRELRRANEILRSGGCRTGRRVARQSDPAAPVLTSRCCRGWPWLRRSRVRPPQLEQVVGGGDQLPLAVDGREPSS